MELRPTLKAFGVFTLQIALFRPTNLSSAACGNLAIQDNNTVNLSRLASERIRNVAQLAAIPSRATGTIARAAGPSCRVLEVDDARN